MKVLGLESHKSGFAWVLIEGSSADEFQVLAASKEDFPRNYARAAGLNWVYEEITDLQRQHQFNRAVLKRAEAGQSLNSAILERAEIDGTIQAALFHGGVDVVTYPWATLARLLGNRNRSAAIESLRASSHSAGLIANRLPALGAAIVGIST